MSGDVVNHFESVWYKQTDENGQPLPIPFPGDVDLTTEGGPPVDQLFLVV